MLENWEMKDDFFIIRKIFYQKIMQMETMFRGFDVFGFRIFLELNARVECDHNKIIWLNCSKINIALNRRG